MQVLQVQRISIIIYCGILITFLFYYLHNIPLLYNILNCFNTIDTLYKIPHNMLTTNDFNHHRAQLKVFPDPSYHFQSSIKISLIPLINQGGSISCFKSSTNKLFFPSKTDLHPPTSNISKYCCSWWNHSMRSKFLLTLLFSDICPITM